MNDDIIPPLIPDGKTVDFTDDQLRQVYDRIELIDKHFNRCCAAEKASCHYDGEYENLYKILGLAGLAEHKTPINREEFEQWLQGR